MSKKKKKTQKTYVDHVRPASGIWNAFGKHGGSIYYCDLHEEEAYAITVESFGEDPECEEFSGADCYVCQIRVDEQNNLIEEFQTAFPNVDDQAAIISAWAKRLASEK